MVPSEIFHSRILVSERGGWRLAGFVQCRRRDVQPFPYVPAASLDDYLSGRRRRAAPKKIGNLAKFLLGFSCRNNQIILYRQTVYIPRREQYPFDQTEKGNGTLGQLLLFRPAATSGTQKSAAGYRFNRNAKKSVSTVQTLRDPEEILK